MRRFVSRYDTWPTDTPVLEGLQPFEGDGWPWSPRVLDGAHLVWVSRGSSLVAVRLTGSCGADVLGSFELVSAGENFRQGLFVTRCLVARPAFRCWRGRDPVQGEGWLRLPQVLTTSASCGCWGERFCGC
jgi:hypothetical protein